MTTSSFIVAVELGSFNHNQKLENGYLAFIALAASSPMSSPLRFKEVRLVNVVEAAKASAPAAPM